MYVSNQVSWEYVRGLEALDTRLTSSFVRRIDPSKAVVTRREESTSVTALQELCKSPPKRKMSIITAVVCRTPGFSEWNRHCQLRRGTLTSSVDSGIAPQVNSPPLHAGFWVEDSTSCATDFFQVDSFLNLIVAREEEQTQSAEMVIGGREKSI